MRAISELPSLAGGKPQLRLGSSANNQVDGDEPAVTDNGLYIIDVFFDVEHFGPCEVLDWYQFDQSTYWQNTDSKRPSNDVL